jgi:hypothetical protein
MNDPLFGYLLLLFASCYAQSEEFRLYHQQIWEETTRENGFFPDTLRWRVVCFLIIVFSIGGCTPTASAGKPMSTSTIASVEPSTPNFHANLSAVATISATQAWAVGSVDDTPTHDSQALIERWDGVQWQRIAVPESGRGRHAFLNTLTVVSPQNIWAMGSLSIPQDPMNAQPLIEHWDGHIWSIVPSPPGIKNRYNILTGAVALSPDDIWAVGFIQGEEKPLDLYYQTLIEHWDGHTWSIAGPMMRGSLHSVTALSAKNVWAVGTEGYPQIYHTFVEHWNGASWTRMSSPNAPGNSFLNSVKALSTKNIWAVGSSSVTYPLASQTLIEHWDGKTWRIVQSPNGDGNLKAELNSVAVISENDIWAVGQLEDKSYEYRTLIEHWNGQQWHSVLSPNAGHANDGNALSGSAGFSTTMVWAVGTLYFDDYPNTTTIIERWDGNAWKIVPGARFITSLAP